MLEVGRFSALKNSYSQILLLDYSALKITSSSHSSSIQPLVNFFVQSQLTFKTHNILWNL